VQAEVDVAIAVKLIHFAQMPNVKSISLFAGDRDFYDAIEYVQETFLKPVQILAFKDNVTHRFEEHLNIEVILLNSYWETICNGGPIPDSLEKKKKSTRLHNLISSKFNK
jgi:uncharacterized LabA/DUF88 family protein